MLDAGVGAARDLRGHVEARGIFYPTLSEGEARTRLFARYDTIIDKSWIVVASACVDAVAGTGERGTAGIVRPLDSYLERRDGRVELRLGISNVAWGVLDELSPQDVINPVDVSRFVLEGRSESRLPVPMARVRVFLPASLTLEGIIVPFARRGAFDQLDEPTSPFAPEGLAALPKSDAELSGAALEGGLRVKRTGSGIDWGLSMYHDTVDFDRYEATETGLSARRPSRWMAGGDVEAAIGEWVLRGDGALFIHDPLQADGIPAIVPKVTFQGGMGADRRVGDNAFYFNALYSFVPDDPRIDGADDVSFFGGYTRDLKGGTSSLRLFGLWNALSDSGFGRATWEWELVENLRFDVSGSVFLGQGRRVIRLNEDADLLTARLRFYF